jgi:hypothetical protein
MIMSEDRDNMNELLSAYIDGETTQQQADSIEQAVATDPELAMELHELRAARQLLTGLPLERAPRGFVRKVMVRAERKHLLGDHHAGGAFGAARWITLAVAAVVLLAAGIGIITINNINRDQVHAPLANLDIDGRMPGYSGNIELEGKALHAKRSDKRSMIAGKGSGDSATVSTGTLDAVRPDGKVVIADAAFDYAVANASNAIIYTANVTDTLAVLEETLYRNDVQPLDLEAPAADPKPALKPTDSPAGKMAEKKRNVSHGGLNFYYNKKQDAEQVQIVVLATDEVITQLNGDLDKLASVQEVSQAPVTDDSLDKSGNGYFFGGVGPQNLPKAIRPLIFKDGATIAQVDGYRNDRSESKEEGIRASRLGKSKKAASGWDRVIAKGIARPVDKATDPAVPPARQVAKPEGNTRDAVGEIVMLPPDLDPVPAKIGGAARRRAPISAKTPSPSVRGKKIAPATPAISVTPVTAEADELKNEVVDKVEYALKLKPSPMPKRFKRPEYSTATKPAEPVLALGGAKHGLIDADNSAGLANLSSQIAEQQKRVKPGVELDMRYAKLYIALRQQVMIDNFRRNMQSQKEQGINVQALIINLNRRSVRGNNIPSTQNNAIRRAIGALSRPRAAATSAPISESATQHATPAAKPGK